MKRKNRRKRYTPEDIAKADSIVLDHLKAGRTPWIHLPTNTVRWVSVKASYGPPIDLDPEMVSRLASAEEKLRQMQFILGSRLRQCKACGESFYARRSNKDFCRDGCRVRWFRKAKGSEYQRRHRQQPSSRKQRNRNGE